LKKLIVARSKVIREGKLLEVLSSDLVPGDVILLSSGDRVPADARIIALSSLEVNEAILTGESMPVEKIVEIVKKDAEIPDRKNMLFMGTQVINGECKAVIVNTNMETVFGKIAGTLQEIENPKTPMQKRLDKFSKQLGIMIIFVSLIVMVLGTMHHEDSLINMFIISVTLQSCNS
jgi:Ca2+-transporting ATPase